MEFLGTFFRLISKSWFLQMLAKKAKEKFIKEIERFIEKDFDSQLCEFVENLKVVVRETDFARKYFPELLSVEDPEDLLELKITSMYPDEEIFKQFRKNILCSIYTMGFTREKARKVFLPITKKSVEIMIKGALLLCAISKYGHDDIFFNRALIITRSNFPLTQYEFFLGLIAKKVDLWTKSENSLSQNSKLVEPRYDLVLADALSLIEFAGKQIYEMIDNFSKDLVIITGFGITKLKISEMLEEAKNNLGLNLRIVNVYGSAETFLMALGVYFDDSNPYSAPFGWMRPIYLTSATVGAKIPSDFSQIPTRAEDFIHAMSGRGEYLTAATVATAFSIPNYLLHDLMVNKNTYVNIFGRGIVYVGSVKSLGELFTGDILGIGGIITRQDFSHAVAEALNTEDFLVILMPCVSGVEMKILVKKIAPGMKNRLISMIKYSRRHKYILDNIITGNLHIDFEERPDYDDICARIYERCPRKYKIFVAGEFV